MILQDHPHRRLNILTNEWVLCSPHRTKRPWQGKVEKPEAQGSKPHDPACYLCPGNSRAGNEKNPAYTGTHVFNNDFSALYPDVPREKLNMESLLVAESEAGLCRVLCYSPRHDLTMALLDQAAIVGVIEAWAAEYISLGKDPGINYVQIFENRGAMMGCSNPHPHGQIWANRTVPVIPAKEDVNQKVYFEKNGRCMLCDYAALEASLPVHERSRIIFENKSFLALVPFWAVWPYETMVIPKKHYASIDEMDIGARKDLANALKRLATRYDNLFLCSFPYSMGIHQAPTDSPGFPKDTSALHPHWHFHFHFYPPLLRSATIQKFMVGYEMLAMPQRDITAEQAAEKLRGLLDKHYSEGESK
ncbi:MAG: UDP-glucose--hexose-1-phosphate uridylyltransferase [Spirochaetaceae bacterium]|nr:MAG: UDP-glucose--hexose-1-phosphate uridylyltransferase [Spirochaetaceae bacterium]